MNPCFALKGNICYAKDEKTLVTVEHGYVICEDGVAVGAFEAIPDRYAGCPMRDFGDALILPGLVDLHVHAPQFAYRTLGLDMELLDWLDKLTFPEEAKYQDIAYADERYDAFVKDLVRGPNTRAVVFATVHAPATLLLMDKLEASGLSTMVGKVNMDRNCPKELCEPGAAASLCETEKWLSACEGRYRNTAPILTPRFIPSCSDALMRGLGELQHRTGLAVQSHLSENQSECAWVRELCPQSAFYGDAYQRFGLFGGDAKTVMAHCVQSSDEEIERMRERGVFVAHCPQSNTNIASGIAPMRRILRAGVKAGLGSDVAGGCHTSIFRAMSDAIQVSKLHWRLVRSDEAPLTLPEAFFLATIGGGAFFGKVGSFKPGYEFDAIVVGDRDATERSIEERLARAVYLSDDRDVLAKYVKGTAVLKG